MNSFDPAAINPVSGTPGVVTFAGRNGVPERAFATDLNNVGPRAGFAYSFDGNRTVIRGGAGVFYGSTVSNTIGDTAALGFSTAANFVVAQATTQSAFRLREGFPAYARPSLTSGFGAVRVGERPNTSVSYFDPHQMAPVSYQSNLGIQHEFESGLVVEAGYIGNTSHHPAANDFSLNQLAPEFMGPGDTQRLRPFPQFSNVVLINPAIDNSTYHAGFVRVQKRFARGFSLLAHYTRSRFMDDAESSNEYGARKLHGRLPSRARLGSERQRCPRPLRADDATEVPGSFKTLSYAPSSGTGGSACWSPCSRVHRLR